ncbi:MAG: hypothetical protein AAFU65_16985, partial [Pseudomonadota bacterium]
QGLRLHNVRLQDPDTFVPIAQRFSVDLGRVTLPAVARAERSTISVNDEMLFGKADRTIDLPVSRVTGVSRMNAQGIMLVRGWCANSTWPINNFQALGVTRHYTDGQNSRSHDSMARRLRDQGNANYTTAFTAIGHSQGGAAATHLLTYYSSRLDNTTAPRPVQSLGTPYKGSTLMDLYVGVGGPWGFVLSEIFGFCGPQLNLTTVGSALWLTGIPNSVRSDVHYYRTRHRRPSNFWQRLQFWRWRCNLASFIIPRSDDGVVGYRQGELSGGNNRGIRDRQCHTGGMKYADQTDDVSRNAEMEREARPVAPPPPAGPDARCTVSSQWIPGGPFGGGYTTYYVDAGGSIPGANPISQYQWRLNGASPGPFTTTSRFGPLSPGLPGQASYYLVHVTVRDTAGRTDFAVCAVP